MSANKVDKAEVSAWLAECCTSDPASRETLLSLTDDYNKWAYRETVKRGLPRFAGTGGLRLGKSQLSGLLRELGYKSTSKGLTRFVGIRLNSRKLPAAPSLRRDEVAPLDAQGQLFLRWLDDNCLTGPTTAYATRLPDAIADYSLYSASHPDRYERQDRAGWLQDYWDRVHPITYGQDGSQLPSYHVGRSCLMLHGLGLKNPPQEREARLVFSRPDARDVIRCWIRACCIDAQDRRTQSSEMYRNYAAWCETNEERPLKQVVFSKMMEGMGYVRARSNGLRYLVGLTLKPIGLIGTDHEAA